LLQGNFLGVVLVKREAKQAAQAGQHAIGAFGIVIVQGGNTVERIEKEVRLELCFQALKLGSSQTRFERSRLNFAVAKPPIRIHRVPDADDAGVNQPIEMEMVE